MPVTQPAPPGYSTLRSGVAARLRGVMRAGLDVALPPLCPGCREMVGDAGGLCARCWSRLSFIARPYCERLGIPFAYDPGPGVVCAEAISHPPAFARARAAVAYDDLARDLVHLYKYGDRLDLAPTFGRWMAAAGAELLESADILVPVPLHWRRLWMRRFNQAAALVQAVSAQCGVPFHLHALARIRPTRHQVGLNRADRAQNVQGAFQVPDAERAALRGRRVVLVDDVMTSGATADTCARVLLRAGAANVDVVVFARVVEAVRAPI